MTLVDLTYTAFMVPISVAFDQVQGGAGFTWINIVDIVGCKSHGGAVSFPKVCRVILRPRKSALPNFLSLILHWGYLHGV